MGTICEMLGSAEFQELVQKTNHEGKLDIVVRFQIMPGKKEQFMATFQPCIDRTLTHGKGVIKFEMKNDLTDPNRLWLFEEWEGIDGYRHHMQDSKESGVPKVNEMIQVLDGDMQFIIAK